MQDPQMHSNGTAFIDPALAPLLEHPLAGAANLMCSDQKVSPHREQVEHVST